jgi:glycosyltransferase involved in cell wall biosynthesis
LADWYRAADLFVLPSRSEGVPNVLLEASACGCPWVASRVGGISEIAHLGQSRLVPPDDPHALAAAIRDSLGRPPGTLVPPRGWDATVDEMEQLLRQVTDRRTPLPSGRPKPDR